MPKYIDADELLLRLKGTTFIDNDQYCDALFKLVENFPAAPVRPEVQIAEMERKNPLIVFEAIKGMSVWELIDFMMDFQDCSCCKNPNYHCYDHRDCRDCLFDMLNSPYTKEDGE
ncbi:MAG: hypothetical protein VB062_04690 [Christensenella sp.]|nr:hypothetical protein [Christensenella sp.]